MEPLIDWDEFAATLKPYHTVRYGDHCDPWVVQRWCEQNCQGKFYNRMDWNNWQTGQSNRAMQFSDEKDAVMFQLAWT